MSKNNRAVEFLIKSGALDGKEYNHVFFASAYPADQVPASDNLTAYIIVATEKGLNFYQCREQMQAASDLSIDWLDINSAHENSSFGLKRKFIITYNGAERIKVIFYRLYSGHRVQNKAVKAVSEKLLQITTKEF